MKYAFKDIEVGDKVIVENRVGERIDMRVKSVERDCDTSFPIRLDACDPDAAPFMFACTEMMTTPIDQAFKESGHWYGTGSAKIIKIKKPWKMFTALVKLRMGDKVRIQQDGQQVTGKVVAVDDAATADTTKYAIEFDSSIRLPGGIEPSVVHYYANGTLVWSRPGTNDPAIRAFDIRKYKRSPKPE